MLTRANRTSFGAHAIQRSHQYSYAQNGKDNPGTLSESYENEQIMKAIHDLPQQLQSTLSNTKLLQSHIPNFRGQKTNSKPPR